MLSLQPLLHSIFHPPVSTLEASVSSAITSIGDPSSRDYHKKIKDWLTATGLPPKSSNCNLQTVLNNIQNIMNGISIKKPDSVLLLDISKAIQDRLNEWGVLQKQAVFNAKDMKYSWVITDKKADICMSINLPTDKTCYGLHGSNYRHENINKILSEIKAFLSQINSLCNLMNNQLIKPDNVLLSERMIISLEQFIDQIQVNIKNKVKSLEEIRQDCIRTCQDKEKETHSASDVYKCMELTQESLFLRETIEKIEEEKIVLSDDINKLYHSIQFHGIQIQQESFFPYTEMSEFLRQKKNILSFMSISHEELLQQINENIGGITK